MKEIIKPNWICVIMYVLGLYILCILFERVSVMENVMCIVVKIIIKYLLLLWMSIMSDHYYYEPIVKCSQCQ